MTEAIARMNMSGKDVRVSNTLGHAPLALPEVIDLGSEYAQVTITHSPNKPCIFVSCAYLYMYFFVKFCLTANTRNITHSCLKF